MCSIELLYADPTLSRGIPSGYLTQLEQRLLETEIALFDTLSASSSSFQDIKNPQDISLRDSGFSEHSSSQSKELKIEEWKRFPLALVEQRQVWLQEKFRITKGQQQPWSATEPFLEGQQQEQQWLGSSQLPGIQNGSALQPHDSLPDRPQKWRFVHQDTQELQKMMFDDYTMMLNKEQGLDVHDDAAEIQNQTSESLVHDVWTSPAVPKQAHRSMLDQTESLGSVRDGDEFATNSSPSSGRPLSTELSRNVKPAAFMDVNASPKTRMHDGSISRNSGQQEFEVAQISAKEWHKYF